MNTLNPLQKNTSGFPLTVPSAFRAWATWANTQGCGCLQVHAVKSAFDGREGEHEALYVALCEVYSRAVHECAIALHFDKLDSTPDVHVAMQIASMWDWNFAAAVHIQCGTVGPVVRPWADVIRLALQDPQQAPDSEPALPPR